MPVNRIMSVQQQVRTRFTNKCIRPLPRAIWVLERCFVWMRILGGVNEDTKAAGTNAEIYE